MKNITFIFSTILFVFAIIGNIVIFDFEVRADNEVVAIVNGQELSRQELANSLIDTYGREGLEILIRRTLVGQEADRLNIKVTQEEIAERIDYMVEGMIKQQMKRGGLKDEDDLERELEKAGLTIEKYKRNVIKSLKLTGDQVGAELLAEKIIKKTINITDEELHEAYEEQYGEKIIATQIVLRMKRDAEKILEKINAGADFGALARKESIDRASASRAGKMIPFGPYGTLGKAAANLTKGKISEIIKTDSGYHILKVDNRVPRSLKKFSEVKDDLIKLVTSRKIQNRINPWLLNLVETAEITKNLTD